MKTIKKIMAVAIVLTMIVGIFMMSTISSSASGTGTGLAEWCLNAYNSKWSYVYGGCTPGTVDCSGLIYSYAGGIRTGNAQLNASDYVGYVSNGVPRIHGLGLYKPGHVGVYVGNDMAVDARGSQWGVCYESVYSHGWTKYFKVAGVSYPTNGWVTFNGSKYYYENGQYVANTTKTIGGKTYTFASSGKCTNASSVSDSSTSTETTTKSSTLKKGSQGKAVEKLQNRLYELGYYSGPVDGDFGDGTEEAFKLFQKQAGLYVDGLAGSDVEYLYADNAPKFKAQETKKKDRIEVAQTSAVDESEDEDTSTSFENGDYDDEIVKIQQRLIDLGYLNGDADGSFGDMTQAAVSLFQEINGITQTGVADEFTVEVLYSIDAKENPDRQEQTDAVENETQPLEVVQSELPQPTDSSNIDTATEVTLETTKTSEKALANIAGNITSVDSAKQSNLQFIIWLAVMIVVMTIAFFIVQAIEKKKAGKKSSGKYF